MARFHDPSPAEEKAWKDWIAGRPPHIRAVAERYDPWTLYRMASTGQCVVILSFFNDGTVRVAISAQFNAVLHERSVFGVDPNTLTECDLPSPDEPVGAVLNQQEVKENIDVLRTIVRPDLWTLGPDGRAKRKH